MKPRPARPAPMSLVPITIAIWVCIAGIVVALAAPLVVWISLW
jgi:hypothetical protein